MAKHFTDEAAMRHFTAAITSERYDANLTIMLAF